MPQHDFKKHLDALSKHDIRAQLIREFLSKGLAKPAIQSINIHLCKLETQAEVLRDIARDLKEESDE